MAEALKITKLYTDNPFTDVLIYCVKLIAYGCVIKSEPEALRNETNESYKKADEYMLAIEGKGDYLFYTYNEEILKQSSVPKNLYRDYLRNSRLIDEKYRDELVSLARKYVLENYEERNNYYRTITGLPKYGDPGIPLVMYKYLIPKDETLFDNITYVHECNGEQARLLEKYGVLDIIKQDYPDEKYLDYLTADISIYKARKCMDKQILYQPSCGLIAIDDQFKLTYENCREFVRRKVDSTAMDYESPQYQNFLICYILFLTMLDIITDLQTHIVKKDILDARCIAYIFEMYGVPYYKSIPIKYQTSMCKNINHLVQYKSSPEEMFTLIDLFGVHDEINVYKYYLLRHRLMDGYGDYRYKEDEMKDSKFNTILEHRQTKRPGTDNTIPYPFPYFLQKGNVMFVWADGYRLVEDEDYEIYGYDKIRFLNDIDPKEITYDFYYDKTTVNSEDEPNTNDSIKLSYYSAKHDDENRVYDVVPPYPDYFKDGNTILVSVNSLFLPLSGFTVNPDTNQVTINDSYRTAGEDVWFVFAYGSNNTIKFESIENTATEDGQTIFDLPEPFPYYIINGNAFVLTLGSIMVLPERYRLINNDTQIEFIDGTKVAKGRSLTFNFIYSTDSIYKPLDHLEHTSYKVYATDFYQYRFKIKFPYENYLERGLKVYVKIFDWFIETEFFDIHGDELRLIDTSMALQPGEFLEVHFIYPKDLYDTQVVAKYRVKTVDKWQKIFTVNFPFDNYVRKGNACIIDAAGTPLTEGVNYEWIDEKKTVLQITDPYLRPFTTQAFTALLIYNPRPDTSIDSELSSVDVEYDGQYQFYLKYPFFPYFQTGHSCLFTNNSTFIRYNEIDFSHEFTTHTIDISKGIKPEGTFPFVFEDIKFDQTPLNSVSGYYFYKGEKIYQLYIYTHKYKIARDQLLTVETRTVPVPKDEVYNIPIPEPFNNYISNQWPYFVDFDRYRQDENNDYEVINDAVVPVSPDVLAPYKNINFTFIYKNCYPWLTSKEDYDNDMDLKFVKIPLEAMTNSDEYVKKLEDIKYYDPVTIADRFWDGIDGMHEDIKAKILEQEFNYSRTKYLSIDNVVSVAELSFDIPYFYSMLYDDVYLENELTVEVPSISPAHKFNLAYLFCYMTAITYVYLGLEDKIMDTPSKVLYCKGFNFKADLEALKKYILDERRLPSDYDVWDFIIPKDQISDIPTFINIFNNNKAIYNTIVEGMAEANDYDIYSIWKKLYDSLMIWKFNQDFFKLSSGKVASSFTEFLEERDTVLYTDIQRIRAIEEEETRQNQIVTTISDIVYILDDFIDSKKFRYIYSFFPGESREYILQYLFTIINFFKSYKVEFLAMNTALNLNDKNENLIRPHDVIASKIVHLDKPEYIALRDSPKFTIKTNKTDSVSSEFREALYFTYSYT